MVGVLFLAGAYGAAAAVAVGICNALIGWGLDPVTAWILVAAGYIAGWTDGWIPPELRRG